MGDTWWEGEEESIFLNVLVSVWFSFLFFYVLIMVEGSAGHFSPYGDEAWPLLWSLATHGDLYVDK